VRKAIDMQNEELRLINNGSLLDQIVLFALSAKIALNPPLGFKLEAFIMPEAIDVGVLTPFLLPGLSTGLADKLSIVFYLEELLEVSKAIWHGSEFLFQGIEKLQEIFLDIFLIIRFLEVLRPFIF
jgi:hypothetical protein